MVRAMGELASVAFESGAHASRRRGRCSVEIGRSVGVVGPKSPECSATVGSTLENRDGDVEEGRTTVAPARVPWAMPWRGVVWAASDAADSCEAFAKLLRARISCVWQGEAPEKRVQARHQHGSPHAGHASGPRAASGCLPRGQGRSHHIYAGHRRQPGTDLLQDLWYSAASMTSLSPFSSSLAKCRAPPSCATAASTTSLSPFSSSLA